jgi:chromosome partitioning protein
VVEFARYEVRAMTDKATVLVLASQKGGAGKTTLSGHLAVEAEQQGDGPVALIDTDPQGSLTKWWNVRAAETPVFAQLELADLQEGIERLRSEGFRLIVIDTPPAVTSSIVEVVSHADLVIVPTRPSPHDLRAVGATVDLIEYQKKPLVFVVNAATPRTRIMGETAVALSQHGVVAPVTIHHRIDFAASMIDGRTVGEVDANSRSAKEISALWLYLTDRIQRLKGDPEVLLNGRKHSFDTELLTPEPYVPVPATEKPRVERPKTEKPRREEQVPDASAELLRTLASQQWDGEWRKPDHDTPPGEPERRASEPWDGLERRKEDRGPPPRTPERRASEPWDGLERRKEDRGPPSGLPERRASEPWDGVERRKEDRGPPPGVPERRQVPSFGKRGVVPMPAPDTILKRFNA